MTERTQEQIEQSLAERGIVPGMYVSWVTGIGTKRYGCVMGYHLRGMVDVQASNGRLSVEGFILKPEPDCPCAITADQKEIYG